MRRSDKVVVRSGGTYAQEFVLNDACCTEKKAISKDAGGFAPNGEMTVRIFNLKTLPFSCGDHLRPAGSSVWYTVTEIRRHVRPDGASFHWKIVCKQ
ncbi:MAG: hypothetical protein IKW06_02175 [Clostridia bacterium]|nr:hypothetical protein [Clostridia bacterium]